EMVVAMDCARVLAERMRPAWSGEINQLAHRIVALANNSLNSHRAMLQIFRVTASLAKTDERLSISETNLETLMQLCGASDPFAERLAANPALIASLDTAATAALRRDYRAILRTAIDAQRSFH